MISSLNTIRFIFRHPLNRQAKFAAMSRFLRWQLGSRLLPGAVALPFVDGTSLFTERGMTGATGNWYCGLHELNEMAFLLHTLRSTDFFLDVGANIGSYTILAAGAVGARTLAVEPVPATYSRLMRNISLNNLSHIAGAWCGGLSLQDGVINFTGGLDTMNHVVASGEDAGQVVEVAVKTLDGLLAGEVPTLIKIDVEGHENSVLDGGTRTLSDSKVLAVIMETNGSGARYGLSDDLIFQKMSSFGFSPYIYDGVHRELKRAKTEQNTIFIRDVDYVLNRIRAAPHYNLVTGEF